MIRRLATALETRPAATAATERLAQLRAQVYGIPKQALDKSSHSVFPPLMREYRAPRTSAYWNVQEIWEWPRAVGQPWTDLKKQSIRQKLQALLKRGKGPLAKGTCVCIYQCLCVPNQYIKAKDKGASTAKGKSSKRK